MKEKERMLGKKSMTLKLEKMTKSQLSESQMFRNELSKKRSLQERGITLIALVVTIIILLILAGVTLNMALSDNGLFKKAQQVAQKSTEAMIKEEVAILFTEWEADYYEKGTEINGRSGDTMSGAFVEYDGTNIIYEKDGKTYEMPMSENGDIGEMKEVEPDKNSQSYKARHPEDHIPVGFNHTIGTVNEGYVIEDKDGNEFVWIPVDGKRIKYEKKLGKVNVNLSDQNISSLEDVIQGDKLGTFDNGGELASKLSSTDVSSDSKEKSIINSAGGFWVGRYEAGIDTKESRELSVIKTNDEVNDDASDEFDEYWDNNINNIVVKQDTEPIRMISGDEAVKVANSWKNSDEIDENHVAFQSGLITGTQWDTMCEFIGWNECNSLNQTWGNFWNILGQENYTGFHSEVPGSNWIKNSEVKQKPACKGICNTSNTSECTYWIFPTGKFINSDGETTEKKHIFDIGGNVWEITTEICSSYNYFVARGSCANNDSRLTGSACSRNGYTPKSNACYGFRMVLYVQ